MALDGPKDDDTCEQVEGMTFVIDKSQERMVGVGRDIRVDHMDGSFGSGFHISTTLSSSSCSVPY
jgi:hypothetical protein